MSLILSLTSCITIKKTIPSNDLTLFCERLIPLTNRYSIDDQLEFRDLSEKTQKDIKLKDIEILDTCNPQ